MFIFGFPTREGLWYSNPFDKDENTPEYEICEACHLYEDSYGQKYVGFELDLELPMEYMQQLLSPFSRDLDIRKVD